MKTGGYSHYPLCEGTLDNVVGIVSTKDLLLDSLTGRRFDLRSCARDVPSIPESVSALKALELMKKSAAQVALVIDEFGGLQGLSRQRFCRRDCWGAPRRGHAEARPAQRRLCACGRVAPL